MSEAELTAAKIPVRVADAICEWFMAGEHVHALAYDYDLDDDQILLCLRWGMKELDRQRGADADAAQLTLREAALKVSDAWNRLPGVPNPLLLPLVHLDDALAAPPHHGRADMKQWLRLVVLYWRTGKLMGYTWYECVIEIAFMTFWKAARMYG